MAVRPSLKPIEAEAQEVDDDLSQDGEAADAENVREEDEMEEEEEAQEPKVRRAPKEPTKAERERHEALHLP